MSAHTDPPAADREPHAELGGLDARRLLRGARAQTAPAEPAPEPSLPNPATLAELFPDYEIESCLGRGGMGAVYRARHAKLDRAVALKVLPTAFADDPNFAERFLREARALARLSHPHIVAVYDFGEVDGVFYLVMELVDGLNLRQAMQLGRLSPEEALRLVPQVCQALEYAHDHGVVHRDIKPENILIDANGTVRIADFGIAKLVDGSGGVTLTQTHHVVGTPHYMAPEQLETPAAVDHRADIYSIGVLLYEMLTGRLPLGRFDPPSSVASVGRGVDDVVMRSLERDPERRYQTVRDVRSGVEAAADGRSCGSRTRESRHDRRRGQRGRERTPHGVDAPGLSRHAAWAGASFAAAGILTLTGAALVGSTRFREFVVSVGHRLPDVPGIHASRDWLTAVAVLSLVAGGLAAIAAPLLGARAIREIRDAAGRLHGMGLAVAVVFSYPLLVIDGLVLMPVANVDDPDLRRLAVPATAIVLLALNLVVLVRLRAWFLRDGDAAGRR